jgi:hypothetical protein
MIFNPNSQRCGQDLLFYPQNNLAGIVLKGQYDDAFTVRIDDLRFASPTNEYFRSVAPLFLNYDWGNGQNIPSI